MKKIVLLLSAISLLTSCFEDKGNYSYKDINEVNIENSVAEYYVSFNDNLKITPVFTSSQGLNENNYTYEWKMINGSNVYILSHARNLDVPIRVVPNLYNLYFSVTDNTTGLVWQQKFKVDVVIPDINEGYLALCEVSDTARLDMISYNKSSEEFKVLPNVLELVGSNFRPKGKPIQVACFSQGPQGASAGYQLYILTSAQTNRLDAGTFLYDSVKHSIAADFPINKPPKDFKADAIYGAASRAVLLAEGNVYSFRGGTQFNYAAPANMIGALKNKALPAMSMLVTGVSILFNTDSSRFMSLAATGTSWVTLATSAPLFPWKTNKKVVFLANNYVLSNNTYAVLRDSVTGTYDITYFTNTEQKKYTTTSINPNADITLFAPSHTQAEWVFYAQGTKVYRCDLETGMVAEMLDVGKPITLLKFHHFFSTIARPDDYGKWRENLIVSFYDPAGTEGENGTIRTYKVRGTGDGLDLYQEFTGLGKVKSLSYRER